MKFDITRNRNNVTKLLNVENQISYFCLSGKNSGNIWSLKFDFGSCNKCLTSPSRTSLLFINSSWPSLWNSISYQEINCTMLVLNWISHVEIVPFEKHSLKWYILMLSNIGWNVGLVIFTEFITLCRELNEISKRLPKNLRSLPM